MVATRKKFRKEMECHLGHKTVTNQSLICYEFHSYTFVLFVSTDIFFCSQRFQYVVKAWVYIPGGKTSLHYSQEELVVFIHMVKGAPQG